MFAALSQEACIAHSQTGPATVPCCPGLTPWQYDAKTGIPYGLDTKACWWAPCAEAGQWAGAEGSGNSCCTGLLNVAGKCAQPVVGGGGGGTPLPGTSGGFDLDFSNPWVIGGIAAAAILVVSMM
jgi:hypothetical protein